MKKEELKAQFIKDINETMEKIKDKYEDIEGLGLIAIATCESQDSDMVDACVAVLGEHSLLVNSALNLITYKETRPIFRQAVSIAVSEIKSKSSTNFNMN